MKKCDPGSMQKISAERGKLRRTNSFLPRRTIKSVSYNRAAERRKMDANLMRAAGMEVGFD